MDATNITGLILNAQISGLAASKITGQLTDSQLQDIATTKLIGTISTPQIANNAITLAKFSSGIEPITIVTSVPGSLVTKTVLNSTDGKLYRWNGLAYTAAVATTDLTGTVLDAQIAGLAAAKLTGQIVVVPAVFVGEPLGVEPPAFIEGRIVANHTQLPIAW